MQAGASRWTVVRRLGLALLAAMLAAGAVFAWRFYHPPVDPRIHHMAAQLELAGAQVRLAGATSNVDCKTANFALCNNFANTDVLYQGYLTPCAQGPCPRARRDTVLADGTSSFQLGGTEAMVFLLYPPAPPRSFISLQVAHYERARTQIPEPAGYVPPGPGEVVPPPTSPARRTIDAAIGDTLNTRLPGPQRLALGGRAGPVVFIVSPSRRTAQKVVAAAQSAGIAAAAILIAPLPQGLVYSNGPDGDSFRVVMRLGRPFDEAAIARLPALRRDTAMRVSFPAQPSSDGFGPPTLSPRAVGRAELGAAQTAQLRALRAALQRRFGAPAAVLQFRPRAYDDEFCRRTGSYCWGNNNETIYADMAAPASKLPAQIDLAGPGSRLVVTGVDHVALGYADFWNIGLFARSGKVLNSLLFADLAKLQPAAPGTGGLFWFQFRRLCEPGDINCIDVPQAKREDAGAISVINRIYINPRTGVAPAASEIELPLAYYYPGNPSPPPSP